MVEVEKQWQIPVNPIIRNKFLLLLASYLSSHYTLTYKQISESQTILDVGCGTGRPIRCFKTLGLQTIIIGIDANIQSLKNLKQQHIFSSLILADAQNLPIQKGKFDYAILLQILEHLSKADGYKMLKQLENIANNIIVTTPVGKIEQKTDNPLQQHRCGWHPKELENLGFTVRGYGRPRNIHFSKAILTLMNFFFIPLLRRTPNVACQMVAWIETNK